MNKKESKIRIEISKNLIFSGLLIKPVRTNPPNSAWKLCSGEVDIEIKKDNKVV